MERTVKSLNDDEYEKLLKAMEVHEGWKEGFEEFIEVKSIVGVRMNRKHAISEYLINVLAFLLTDCFFEVLVFES